jgi:hypothetical protein
MSDNYTFTNQSITQKAKDIHDSGLPAFGNITNISVPIIVFLIVFLFIIKPFKKVSP